LSKKEGMPNVVLEAMSAGLPMIVSEFEGFSDDYGMNGEHYLLVERKPESIANTLQSLVRDESLYKAIKQNALERISNHFLVEKSIEQYIQMFNLPY
jgi:glycosyltransferase involved in cell wall biosynthesis